MRKIVFGSVILSALVLGACDEKPSGGETPAASASATTSAASASAAAPAASASAKPEPEKKAEGPKDHKARLKAMEEAYASHDAKKVAALYAEDGVITRPGREPVKGRAEIEKRVAKNFEVFKDMKVTTGRVWEKDKHTVVAEWVGTGTNTGEWPEIGIAKATNKPFGTVGACWLEINDDGLIKEEHNFSDSMTLLGQIEPKKENPVRAIVTAPPDGTEHYDAKKEEKKEEKKDEKAKDEKKEKAEPAKEAETEKKDLEAEDKLMAAFNAGKVDEGLKEMVEDYTNIDYTQDKDQKGKKAFKELIEHFFTAFPDMKAKSLSSFAVGNFVIEEFEYTGTQKGALGPIKATNKPVSIHQLEVDEFKDGKFVKSWSFGNSVELLTELGVVGKDKKEEKKEEKKK